MRLAVAIVAIALVLAGCAATDHGTTYTKLHLAANCGSRYVALGNTVTDQIEIRNTSSHDFTGTYASIDNPDFRVENIQMNLNSPIDLGGGTWNLGSLDAGSSGTIRVQMTAVKGGTAPRFDLQAWGNSKKLSSTSVIGAFPGSAWQVYCDHVIQ